MLLYILYLYFSKIANAIPQDFNFKCVFLVFMVAPCPVYPYLKFCLIHFYFFRIVQVRFIQLHQRNYYYCVCGKYFLKTIRLIKIIKICDQ